MFGNKKYLELENIPANFNRHRNFAQCQNTLKRIFLLNGVYYHINVPDHIATSILL